MSFYLVPSASSASGACLGFYHWDMYSYYGHLRVRAKKGFLRKLLVGYQNYFAGPVCSDVEAFVLVTGLDNTAPCIVNRSHASCSCIKWLRHTHTHMCSQTLHQILTERKCRFMAATSWQADMCGWSWQNLELCLAVTSVRMLQVLFFFPGNNTLKAHTSHLHV